MQPFTLHIPTRIRFGSGVLETLGSEASALGSHALLVYGGGSIKSNRVYETVITQLQRAGVRVTEYSGVRPNPLLSQAEEGAALARSVGADVVVAVGGGSVIDAAKAMAVGATQEGAIWDFYIRSRTPATALPLLAVQTVPASSSEMNGVSVLTNDITREKFSLRSPHISPRVAFLDPAVTTTIPLEYTAYACTDILSHVMEGYFTSTDPWAPIHDGMVEGLARGVIDSMDRLLVNPGDLEARAAVMWAGAIAWSGLMHSGVEGASIPNHMLEHPLSAHYDIAHGAGLSIVIPAWLTWMKEKITPRIIRFGREILRIGPSLEKHAPLAQAEIVIAALTEWYRKIGTPTTFAEGGLNAVDVEACTTQALQLATLWGVTGYTAEDIRGIYRLCNG